MPAHKSRGQPGQVPIACHYRDSTESTGTKALPCYLENFSQDEKTNADVAMSSELKMSIKKKRGQRFVTKANNSAGNTNSRKKTATARTCCFPHFWTFSGNQQNIKCLFVWPKVFYLKLHDERTMCTDVAQGPNVAFDEIYPMIMALTFIILYFTVS